MFTPRVEDIGTLLHARTNVMGTELGTFTADTIVTDEQVVLLVGLAQGDVEARIGTAETVPDVFWPAARKLVALLTATMIEASFFSNQIDTNRSPYAQYTAMYATGVTALAESIKAYGDGSQIGVADDAPVPTFAFPAVAATQLDHAFSTTPAVSPWDQWGWPGGVAPPG